MTEKQAMCALFPDLPCPRGEQSAGACQVRLEQGNYDPVSDFRDYLMMNCAILRAEQQREKRDRLS